MGSKEERNDEVAARSSGDVAPVADATNEQAVSSDVQVLARSTAGNDDGRKPGLDQPTGDPLKETWAIVGMVLCGLVLALVMGFALYSEHTLYESLLVQARDATRACPGVYLAYTASMAPYRSFTFFRAATVFLSFSLILLGAAFSFARIRAGGRAKVTGGEGLSLEVSSQSTRLRSRHLAFIGPRRHTSTTSPAKTIQFGRGRRMGRRRPSSRATVSTRAHRRLALLPQARAL
jgi:hypothetical protein